ncbi:copper resistance protein CopC [Paracoccaceae bacterium]|nr:copper resistance protein CopC [Paracoccaceae bacterium]
MLKKIILVFILFSLATTVFPHSPLKQANPMDGALLSQAPTEYKMLFKSPAKLIKFEIFQKGESNNKKPSLLKGLFKKSDDKLIEINYKPSLVLSERHLIKLPKINFGSYEVRWRAMGEDGHVLKGILTFEVKGK